MHRSAKSASSLEEDKHMNRPAIFHTTSFADVSKKTECSFGVVI